MADYGIKISTPGSDVLTAADKDLVYSSKYNGLKIFSHGSLASSGTVSHGLGYYPAFLNFRQSGGYYRRENAFVNIPSTPTYIDSSNITFGDVLNYYFIFIDKING